MSLIVAFALPQRPDATFVALMYANELLLVRSRKKLTPPCDG